MSTQELTKMMTEIRSLREETLAALSEMDEIEYGVAKQMERWTEIRRVLLRFGDHMREHANQINGARSAIKWELTMPQRILAESEIAWGLLLVAMVGLVIKTLIKSHLMVAGPFEKYWPILQKQNGDICKPFSMQGWENHRFSPNCIFISSTTESSLYSRNRLFAL